MTQSTRIAAAIVLAVCACGKPEAETDGTTGSSSTGLDVPTDPGEECRLTDRSSQLTQEFAGDAAVLGTSTTNDTTETGEVCDHSVLDDCCCFTGVTYPKVGCPAPRPCDEILVYCSDGCSPSHLTVPCYSSRAIDCALQALQEGKPAGIRWRREDKTMPGYSGSSGQLYIVGDGTAMSVSASYADVSPLVVSPVERRPLQPASFFAACAAEASAAVRFGCILQAQAGALIETCAEGYVLE